MAFQESGYLHSIGTMLFHANRQSFHTAGDKERIEGAENGAGHIFNPEKTDLCNKFGRAANEAGNDITVSIEVFRCRVNNYIGAHFKRSGNIRRAERIIGNNKAAVHFMRNCGNAFNIDDL